MSIRSPVPPVGANHTEWYTERDAEVRLDERKRVLNALYERKHEFCSSGIGWSEFDKISVELEDG